MIVYKRPSSRSDEPREFRLGNLLHSYISPSSDCYDAEFRETIERLSPSTINPDKKKEEILLFCRENGRRPSTTSKNSREKQLAVRMRSYAAQKSGCYDKSFQILLDELVPSVQGPEGKKAAVILFIQKNGRRPSSSSEEKEEKKLTRLMHRYTSPSDVNYDESFKTTIERICPVVNRLHIKEAILQFCKEKSRRPSDSSKIIEERKLAQQMYNYLSSSRDSYDVEFKRVLDKLYPGQVGSQVNKEAIIAFCKINGRRPSKSWDDMEERRLCTIIKNYIYSSSPQYDESFKETIDKLCPVKKKFI